MRHGYEADIIGGPFDAKPKAVILSSTYEDLKPYRQRARGKAQELGLQFVGMKGFRAWPESPAELIQIMVEIQTVASPTRSR